MNDERLNQEVETPVKEKSSLGKKLSKLFHKDDSVEVKMLRSERGVKRYQLFLLYMVLLAIAIYVIFFAVIGITQMPNSDMEPNVKAGDVVLFYRLEKDIKLQDVIVFKKATSENDGKPQLLMGRVVARPGDTVEINESNRLIVNGNAILETNIYEITSARDGYTQYPLVLGEDEYFILADSRREGTDSRYFGPVTKDDMLGVVITIFRRRNI